MPACQRKIPSSIFFWDAPPLLAICVAPVGTATATDDGRGLEPTWARCPSLNFVLDTSETSQPQVPLLVLCWFSVIGGACLQQGDASRMWGARGQMWSGLATLRHLVPGLLGLTAPLPPARVGSSRVRNSLQNGPFLFKLFQCDSVIFSQGSYQREKWTSQSVEIHHELFAVSFPVRVLPCRI